MTKASKAVDVAAQFLALSIPDKLRMVAALIEVGDPSGIAEALCERAFQELQLRRLFRDTDPATRKPRG
jgi:hypothetical protein